MASNDCREWIKAMEALGEIKQVEGADWNLEIGTIADIYQEKMGLPALIFDKIKGYPPGFRILANSLTSIKRVAYTLGMPPDSNEQDVIKSWLAYLRGFKLIPPEVVENGPIFENVQEKEDINLLSFPSPIWHELDGGRFMGTGCLVIMKDPDSEWVNLGVYRVQVHDEKTISVMISKGKQGAIIMQKYFDQGKPCPVAVTFGQDLLLYLVGGMEIPYGTSEYDVTGGIRGEAVEIVKGPKTGLPLPATAEIAIEGEIHPNDFVDEGPFGEWHGYYANLGLLSVPEPVIQVKAVHYRNNPIVTCTQETVPPHDDCLGEAVTYSAEVWDRLEQFGIPGVRGVWCHELGHGNLLCVVSIKQMYAGHSRRAGLVASQCQVLARYVIVVEEDIDPSNLEQVLWAVVTRGRPDQAIEILHRCRSGNHDPAIPPEEKKRFKTSAKPLYTSIAIIDGCRGWEWKDDWYPIAKVSPELRAKILEKWQPLLSDIL